MLFRGGIRTVVAPSTRICGDIELVGDALIFGCVEGSVTAVSEGATLTIAADARVLGSIEVPHLVVHGEVTGGVCVTEFLELGPTALVEGSVHYHRLIMPAGARLTGMLTASGLKAQREPMRKGPVLAHKAVKPKPLESGDAASG